MVSSRYWCGVIADCAIVVAAPLALRAQQPAAQAAQNPTPIQLPGPPAPGAALLEPLPMPAILKQYQSISADRLKNPPDADWPIVRRTYDGWGYTPLSQIDTDNVKRLQPAWIFSTGAE